MRAFAAVIALFAASGLAVASSEVDASDALIAKRMADESSRVSTHKRREARFTEAEGLMNGVLEARDESTAMHTFEKRAAKCPKGQVFVYSKRKCYKSKFNCGKKCPINPKNGYWYCPAGPSCALECQYGLTPNRAANSCYHPKFDKNNCGGAGKSCPFSYNGIGTRQCYDSKCKIICPAGYRLVSTPSGARQYCKRS
ncbi:hypothetical protein OIO90_005461 [Microbotryomycetes sp. JL221]|nr:hypothetical protein OIO90_005461 [Microbotryomycetes sp. JL221]